MKRLHLLTAALSLLISSAVALYCNLRSWHCLLIYVLAAMGIGSYIFQFEQLVGKETTPAPQEVRPHPTVSTYFALIVLLGSLAFIGVSDYYYSVMCRPRYGTLTACKSNLKNIGTALEMYSTDNYGRYPCKLDDVTPSYVKVIPTCPSAGYNSYIYIRSTNPDVYTTWCNGSHHTSITNIPNYPQYDSIEGLREP